MIFQLHPTLSETNKDCNISFIVDILPLLIILVFISLVVVHRLRLHLGLVEQFVPSHVPVGFLSVDVVLDADSVGGVGVDLGDLDVGTQVL